MLSSAAVVAAVGQLARGSQTRRQPPLRAPADTTNLGSVVPSVIYFILFFLGSALSTYIYLGLYCSIDFFAAYE